MSNSLPRTIAFISLLACSAAWADSVTLAKLQTIVTEQCRGSKLKTFTATGELERRTAVASMFVNCDCMPNEIEHRVGLNPSLRDIASLQEGLELLRVTLRSCGAAPARKELASVCVAEAKKVSEIADAEAYCGCVKTKVDAVSDDELVDDSERAYREFRARVDTRQKGQADPPGSPTVIDDISASCKPSAGR